MDGNRSRESVERVRDTGAKMLTGLGRTIEEGLKALGERGNVLMVRVNDKTLTSIDALVEAGVFKNRSQAAAFLIHEGLRSRSDIFGRIESTVDEIARLRRELNTILAEEQQSRAQTAQASAASESAQPTPPPSEQTEYSEPTG